VEELPISSRGGFALSAVLRKFIRAAVFENLATVLAVAFAGSEVFLAMWAWIVLAGQPPGKMASWGAATGVLVAVHLAILHSSGGTKILASSFRPSSQLYVVTAFSLVVVAGAVTLTGGAFTAVAAMLGLAGPSRGLALGVLQACTGLGALVAGWSVAEGWAAARRLPQARKVRVTIPALPSALSGLRIAHISDIHIGNGYDPEQIARLVAHVNALDADIIAITGDIFDRDPSVIDTAASVLAGLHAPHGVFAVLGNHDAYAGKELVAAALQTRAPGIRLLRGDIAAATTIPPLYFAGIDDPGDEWRVTAAGARDLDTLARKRDDRAPCVLLVHRPDVFPAAADAGFSLVLSGHYHGGQLAIPGSRGEANAARLISRYYAGVHEMGVARLHVTRGIGCAGPRLRIACPPEISILEIIAET
jgi:predicted MPP superfamily phosphohydrolase